VIRHVFDDRYAGRRIALLIVSGVGYLVFRSLPHDHLRTVDWILNAVALVLCALVVRRPTTAAVALATLVTIGTPLSHVTPVMPMVAASWSGLEATLRRPARPALLAVGSLSVIYLAPVLRDGVSVLPAALFSVGTLIGGPALIGVNLRSTRQLAATAQQAVQVERAQRAAQVEAARSAERVSIARELHDVVAHHVASIVLRVAVARHVLDDADPRIAHVLDDVHATGSAALADLRRLVILLRDPAVSPADPATTTVDPRSLPAALDAAVGQARNAAIIVDAAVDPAIADVDAVRALAVLRLTQEGLTNVARHAGTPAGARLSVTVDDTGAVCWELTDDGGTGRPGPVPAGSGHGLTGLRERVEVLGGRLEAGPAPDGRGWRLASRLPAPAVAP